MLTIFRNLLPLLILLTGFLSGQASVFLDRLLATRAIDPQRSAILVTDLATGEILDALNPDLSLIPASIMKTATIAALLPETGCEFRYETKVYADGKIEDGVLKGNLLIEGSGDPSINAGCEPAGPCFLTEIADALKAHGVQTIEGCIIVNSDIFPGPAVPPSWAAADLKQKYGTGCHGFNFRHNASGSSSVSDPAAVFRGALSNKLQQSGIRLGGAKIGSAKNPKLIFTHQSASIDEIMRSCMMRSDNLFAEALLRTIPVAKGKPGETSLATALAADHWKKSGIDMTGVKLIDGSGLSRENRVTANFIGEVMRQMSSDPDYASFLPLAGQEGTLKNFLKDTDLDSYIALKTGSMNGIQCYAGYKLDDDYVPTHSIVIILNALPKGRQTARSALETYLLGLFSPE